MFADYREPLVEVAAQLLVVLLDHETMQQAAATMNGTDAEHSFEVNYSLTLCIPKGVSVPKFDLQSNSVDTCHYQLSSLLSFFMCIQCMCLQIEMILNKCIHTESLV